MYNTSANFLTKIKEGSRAFKCRVDIGGSINICPLTYSTFWESGTHSSTTGATVANTNRIRLKKLLPVSPSTTYYVHTNDTDPTWDIRFVFVGLDKTGAFVNYFGGIANGGTITTGATVEYLAVSMYDTAGTITNAQFQADILNGFLKPFICLNSETSKAYVAYATSSLDETSVLSFDIENQFSSDAVPSIGGVIAGKLTIKFAIDGVTPSNFTTQRIRPYIGLLLDNGNYEYVPMGVFIPDSHSVVKTVNTVTVECYDILARTGEIPYVGYGVVFPTTIQNVVNDLATTFNVEAVNVSSLPNITIAKRPDNATVRSVICDIAELATANAVADRFGRVAFNFLNTTSFAVDGNNYFKFKLESDANIKISKLVCTKDDAKNNLTVGDATGYTLTFTNDTVKTVADLTTIFNRAYPLTYTPFSSEMQGMPHIDVGDKITITDVKNVARVVPVLYHKVSFSGGVVSSMKAGSPQSTTGTTAGGSGNTITNTINKVVTDVAVINTLVAGNITADNIKANSITADKITAGTITAQSAVLADAVITDAKIDRLSANKVQIVTADIKDANITTAKIGDAQITSAKIGNAQINTAHINDAQITTAKIGDAQITNAKIDRASINKLQVTTADIVDANITNAKIGNLEVTGAKIADATITSAKIGNLEVKTANIDTASITSAKIGDLQVTTAKIGDAQISTAKIQDSAITNAKIDRLSVNKLQVTTADIVDANITNAKIDRASANKLVIVSADIQDASITNAKIDRVSANKLVVTNADIQTMSANKLTAGTIDANVITVTNLKADNIVAGALTIDASNLIHESEFKSSVTWTLSNGFATDATLLYETSNNLKVSRTGLGADSNALAYSEWFPTSAGNTFVASAYTYSPDITLIDGGSCQMIIEYYDSAKTTRLGYSTAVTIKPTSSSAWFRFLSSGVAPANTAYARIRFLMARNGTLNIARPMLQRGSVASEWKPHIDEIISNGAITGDKIAQQTVNAGNIVLNSITSDQIAGKTITADEIAVGTISAKELGTDSVTADKILAGNVTAEKLNVYGLKVTTTDPTPIETFSVTSDGQVKMAGDVQSMNYDTIKRSGWKISSNGNADFYNATIRGDMVLPNAGMTNAYDNSEIYGRNLLKCSNLTGQNSTLMFSTSTWASALLTNAQVLDTLVSGKTYTITYDMELTARTSVPDLYQRLAGLYLYSGTGGVVEFRVSSLVNVGDKAHVSMTFTCPTLTDHQILIYTNRFTTAGVAPYGFDTVQFTNLKIEEGSVATDWSPAPEDDPNPVRVWAGSDYVSRGTAPFRVYQDGSVVANVGTFNGTVSGKIDIGNIHIADTTTTSASIKINNNAETATIIKFEEASSYINTEFIIGTNNTKYLYVNGATKESYVKDISFKVQNSTNANNVFFPNDAGSSLLEFVDGGYFVDYNATTKALAFKVTTNGTQEDFLFTRYNTATSSDVANDVYVKVNGQLESTDQIIMGNIHMKKRADGIDFIVV